jgi:hypothetical protein
MALLGRALSFALVGVLLPACADDGNADASSGSGDTAALTTEDSNPTSSVDSTAGAEPLCNGWSEDGDEPWLELYGVGGQPLVSGGSLTLECGGQGFWMFPIYPRMGGWELADPTLEFSVEVVVEGFAGPFGSFYAEDDYFYSLECIGDELGGFAHDCITVFPPDDSELPMIDGVPATIHIELAVDGGQPIVIDLTEMTMAAPAALLDTGCSPI